MSKLLEGRLGDLHLVPDTVNIDDHPPVTRKDRFTGKLRDHCTTSGYGYDIRQSKGHRPRHRAGEVRAGDAAA